jgi:hypothetical protein
LEICYTLNSEFFLKNSKISKNIYIYQKIEKKKNLDEMVTLLQFTIWHEIVLMKILSNLKIGVFKFILF